MILDFSSFTRRGLEVDLEHPADIWGGDISQTEHGGKSGKETGEDRKTTDLPAVRE